MDQEQVFDEVIARLGESESLEEFQFNVRPFKRSIVHSPYFPNAKFNPKNDEYTFTQVTINLWNEFWDTHPGNL